jgi:hypothetical protein
MLPEVRGVDASGALTVRVDLTVTDQVGSSAPARKTITLLAADGERSNVRSANQRRTPNVSVAELNVDARPFVIQDRVRLELTVRYDLPEVSLVNTGDASSEWSTTVQEGMTIVLDNGKPTTVSQSADPRTDRKVTVEVKATIVK